MSSYICHAWHVTWRKYRHVIVTKPTKDDDDDNIDYYFTTTYILYYIILYYSGQIVKRLV